MGYIKVSTPEEHSVINKAIDTRFFNKNIWKHLKLLRTNPAHGHKFQKKGTHMEI